jgi:hypothetical protein
VNQRNNLDPFFNAYAPSATKLILKSLDVIHRENERFQVRWAMHTSQVYPLKTHISRKLYNACQFIDICPIYRDIKGEL